MKNIFLILILIFFVNLLHAENEIWAEYELDSLITLKLPEEVFELDTIQNNNQVYQIFSFYNGTTFIAQKTVLEKNNENPNKSELPFDIKNLKKIYNDYSIEISKAIPFTLKSKNFVKKQGYLGFKLKYMDSLKLQTYEVEYYILNKTIYTFYYINEDKFDTSEKEKYFNSIKINTKISINQLMGKSKAFKLGYKLGYGLGIILIAIIFIGLVIFLIRILRKRNDKNNITL